MVDEEEMQDRYKRLFDAYLHLQTETYEMIIRNVSIHNTLREVYESIAEDPDLTTEEIYDLLDKNFKKIYTDIFAMFYRPFEVVTYPLTFLVKEQLGTLTPEMVMNSYLGMFNAVGRSQVDILKGFSDIMKGYSSVITKYDTEEEALDARIRELLPLNIVRNMVDEGFENFFEVLNNFFGYLGESQFLIPKTFVVNLNNVFSAYSKIFGLWRRYELMFENVWNRALNKFSEAIAENKEIDFEKFFNTFRGLFSDEYDELLRSDEFIEVQNRLRDTLTDIIRYAGEAIYGLLDMFPVLPFAPRKEVDEVERRMYDNKKVLDSVERRVAAIEEQIGLVPTIDEIDILKKKIDELEKKLMKEKA